MIQRRMILLVLAAAGLAGYAAWNGDIGLPGQQVAAVKPAPGKLPAPKKAQAAPSVQLNPLSTMDVAMFDEISKRPLFNPTRAPAPKEEPPPPAPPQEAPPPPEQPAQVALNANDFTLLAIASSEDGKTAVVRSNADAKVFHLKQGETISDLEVLEVGDRGIKLGKDGQTIELEMFVKAPPPAPGVDASGEPPADQQQATEGPVQQPDAAAQQATEGPVQQPDVAKQPDPRQMRQRPPPPLDVQKQ